MDNGHGMSLETMQTTWMEPATLFRKRQQRSEQYGRRVLGEKGIGRFAASRLANTLEVVTRRTGEDREIRALFDWSQFDDEQKYLDEVEVLWEESAPAEICPGGTIQTLWKEEQTPESSELTHGTILRMEGLRAIWGESQLETLHTGLSRLISPFFEQDQLTGHDAFQIYLELPAAVRASFWHYQATGSPEEPALHRQGPVDETGHYTLTLKLPGQDDQECRTGQFTFPDRHTPQCGPFSIELRVWDRDRWVAWPMSVGQPLLTCAVTWMLRPVSISTEMGSECSPMVSHAMTGCGWICAVSRTPPCVCPTTRLWATCSSQPTKTPSYATRATAKG